MAEYRINCLYEVCPIPLLRTVHQLKKIKIDDSLIVETNSTKAKDTIKAWCEKRNVQYKIVKKGVQKWEIIINKNIHISGL